MKDTVLSVGDTGLEKGDKACGLLRLSLRVYVEREMINGLMCQVKMCAVEKNKAGKGTESVWG